MDALAMVLDATLRGTALILVAALAVRLLRRAPAAARHFCWALALGGVLALPALTALVPWRLPVIPARATAAAPAEQQAAPRVDPVAPITAAPIAPTAAPGPVAVQPEIPSAGLLPAWTIERWLITAWLAGMAIAALRLLLGAVALQWLRRTATVVRDDEWIADLDDVCSRLGVSKRVTLLSSARARTPMTWGVLRPVMVLPADAHGWTAEHREVVLLHELAHVRRGDALAQWLSATACALYWFNPLVWQAARRLRAEAERACDDIVLGAGAPASTYAQTLLSLAQSIGRREAPVLAMPMARRSELEGRVLAILEQDVPRSAVSRRLAIGGACALALVALPLAAMGPVQSEATGSLPGAGVQQETRQQPVPDARRDPVEDATEAPEADEESMPQPEPAPEPAPAPETGAKQSESNSLVITGLVAALRDDDAAVRAVAARALGERHDTIAINALLDALRGDASTEVRLAAAWALGEIESPRAVPGLVQALRSESAPEVRRAIVRALGEIESAEAVDGLLVGLRDRDAETRLLSIWALGEIESPRAVPLLTPLLRDAEAAVRQNAAQALGEIESSDAVEPLMAAWRAEREVEIKRTMLWALAEIEDPRAAPIFEEALRDSEVEVRREAIRGLGDLDGMRRAPAGLLAALRDSDREVRMAAIQAVGDIEDPAAVPALIGMLRDDDVEMRRAVVMALGDIRGTQAVEALVSALRDPDAEVRRLAAHALGDR